ncbi:MAG TPA: hypothetical protein VFJ93_07600 [Gaiellaceae bacterium]|nr:hypothetical protein [Gaiellaceae bacterium]
MLRRAVAAVDGFDIVIVVALVALFVGVAGKYDPFTALIADGAVLLALAALGMWTSR